MIERIEHWADRALSSERVVGWVILACLLAFFLLFGYQAWTQATIDERLETVRCEQWGERFADPCSSR